MPINIQEMTTCANDQICTCNMCEHLTPCGTEAMPGYDNRCILLDGSAFDMIPNETIALNAVFPDCPKLIGTENEGTRYKVFKNMWK